MITLLIFLNVHFGESILSEFHWNDNAIESADNFLDFMYDGANYELPLTCDENSEDFLNCLTSLRSRGEFVLYLGNELMLEELFGFLIDQGQHLTWFGHYLRVIGLFQRFKLEIGGWDPSDILKVGVSVNYLANFIENLAKNDTYLTTDEEILVHRVITHYSSMVARIDNPFNPDQTQGIEFGRRLYSLEKETDLNWFDYYCIHRSTDDLETLWITYEKMQELDLTQTEIVDCYNEEIIDCKTSPTNYYGAYKHALIHMQNEDHLEASKSYGQMFYFLEKQSKLETNILFRDSPYNFHFSQIIGDISDELKDSGESETLSWIEDWCIKLFPYEFIAYHNKRRTLLMKSRYEGEDTSEEEYKLAKLMEKNLNDKNNNDMYSKVVVEIMLAEYESSKGMGLKKECAEEFAAMGRMTYFYSLDDDVSDLWMELKMLKRECRQLEKENTDEL